MSSPSPFPKDSPTRPGREAETGYAAHWIRLADTVKEPLQFVSFWAAIGLPLVHVGLLVQGLETTDRVVLFAALILVNLLALYVGHGYNQR